VIFLTISNVQDRANFFRFAVYMYASKFNMAAAAKPDGVFAECVQCVISLSGMCFVHIANEL